MDPMELSVLEGEIVAVEDAIELELEFAEFDENEMWMPEIGECIKKLEELKKELMEKLRAVKAKKPTAEQEPSKEVVRKIAEKIKELRKLMQKLNEKAKKAREVTDAAASAKKVEEVDKITKQKAREVTDAAASAKNDEENEKIAKQKARVVKAAATSAKRDENGKAAERNEKINIGNEKDAKKGEDENDDENDDESDEKKIEEINLESDEDDEIKKVEKKTAIKRKGELEKKESPEKNKVSESENDEDESETEKEENGEASKDIVKEDVLEHDIKLLPNHDPLVYEVMIEVAAAFPLLQAQRGESVAPSLNLPQTHLKVMNEDELSEDDEEKEVIVNDAKKKKENMEERLKSDNTKIKDCVTREKFHSQEIEKLEEEVERVDETLEETLRKDEEKRDEMKRLEISIAKLDAEREDTEDDDTLGPQLDKAKKEIMKLETSTQDVLHERDNLKLAKIDAARRVKEVGENTIETYEATLLPKGVHIIREKFEEDIIEEEVTLKRSRKVSQKYGSKDTAIKFQEKAVPLVKWLKEAEKKDIMIVKFGNDSMVSSNEDEFGDKIMQPRGKFESQTGVAYDINNQYRQIGMGNEVYGEFVMDLRLVVPAVSVKPREGIGVYKDSTIMDTPSKFFINGDKFFKGAMLDAKNEKSPNFNKLLEHLTRIMCNQGTLPNNESYVYSSYSTFKKLTSLVMRRDIGKKCMELVKDIGVYKDKLTNCHCQFDPGITCNQQGGLELLGTDPQFSGELRRASVQLSGGSERGVHGRGVQVERFEAVPQFSGE